MPVTVPSGLKSMESIRIAGKVEKIVPCDWGVQLENRCGEDYKPMLDKRLWNNIIA